MPHKEPPHRRNLRIGRRSEPGRPYHITKSLPLPAPISLDNESCATAIIDSIRWHQVQRYAHLLAFVVMPDHVHWLFVLGHGRTLAEIMRGFGKATATAMNRALGGSGPLWEEGYHDHAIRTAEEGARAVIEYIHGNPVRKVLSSKPEDWPWTTANSRYLPWIEREYFW